MLHPPAPPTPVHPPPSEKAVSTVSLIVVIPNNCRFLRDAHSSMIKLEHSPRRHVEIWWLYEPYRYEISTVTAAGPKRIKIKAKQTKKNKPPYLTRFGGKRLKPFCLSLGQSRMFNLSLDTKWKQKQNKKLSVFANVLFLRLQPPSTIWRQKMVLIIYS